MENEKLRIGDYISYESAGRGILVGKIESIAGYKAMVALMGEDFMIDIDMSSMTKLDDEEVIVAKLKGPPRYI